MADCRSGKLTFVSRIEAQRNASNNRLKGRLYPYCCNLCGKWHLSSKAKV